MLSRNELDTRSEISGGFAVFATTSLSISSGESCWPLSSSICRLSSLRFLRARRRSHNDQTVRAIATRSPRVMRSSAVLGLLGLEPGGVRDPVHDHAGDPRHERPPAEPLDDALDAAGPRRLGSGGRSGLHVAQRRPVLADHAPHVVGHGRRERDLELDDLGQVPPPDLLGVDGRVGGHRLRVAGSGRARDRLHVREQDGHDAGLGEQLAGDLAHVERTVGRRSARGRRR